MDQKNYFKRFKDACRRCNIQLDDGEYDVFFGCYQAKYEGPIKTTNLLEAYKNYKLANAPKSVNLKHMIFPQPKTPEKHIIYAKDSVSPNTLGQLLQSLPKSVHITPEKDESPVNMRKKMETSNFRWFQNPPSSSSVAQYFRNSENNGYATMNFLFQIDLNSLVFDTRKMRAKSQNATMGGSAKSIFDKLKAGKIFDKLNAEISENVRFHWCHIRGLCLGGTQSADNLLPGTEGSNYFTLAYLELPIMNILKQNATAKFSVKIDIEYWIAEKIPTRITYIVQWGNGRYAKFSIEPLNGWRPSIDNVKISDALYRATKTPPTGSVLAGKEFIPKANKKLAFDEDPKKEQENKPSINL